MTLKSMSLCTMRLHLDIRCAFNESSAVGSLLKYRVIVNSPLMSCGMINSPLYSSLSCSITLSLAACPVPIVHTWQQGGTVDF